MSKIEVVTMATTEDLKPGTVLPRFDSAYPYELILAQLSEYEYKVRKLTHEEYEVYSKDEAETPDDI